MAVEHTIVIVTGFGVFTLITPSNWVVLGVVALVLMTVLALGYMFRRGQREVERKQN